MAEHLVEWFAAEDCAHCGPLLDTVEAQCKGLLLEFRQVSVLAALDRAVALGVLQPPALVLDGRLVIQGAFSARQAIAILRHELEQEQAHADR